MVETTDREPLANPREESRNQYVAKVLTARSELAQAEKRHDADVAAAETALKRAQAEYDTNLKKARAALDQIIKEYTRRVASFAGVELFFDHIVGNGETIPLTSAMTVKLESSGTVETIPDIKDNRTLTLMIESGSITYSFSCDPDKGELALNFLRDILELVKDADVRADEYHIKVEAAEERIKQLEANTLPISNAQEWLSKVEEQTDAIRYAKRVLFDLDHDATADERNALKIHDKGKKRKKIVIWGIVIGVVVIAIIVLILLIMGIL
jgi:hypothetical protein